MFLNHYNMTAHPFCEKPPIDWILNDDRFDQAIARLEFFQEQGDVALILGQTGIGKSSLIRMFKQSIPKNRYRILYLHLNLAVLVESAVSNHILLTKGYNATQEFIARQRQIMAKDEKA